MAAQSVHTDQELVALLKAGDEGVFAQVFKQYYTALCYFAGKFVFDKQEAEDVVEEVFEKLWKGGVELSGGIHLRSYLYMATKRGCIDHLRKRAHAGERQLNYAERMGESEPEYIHEMIRAEVLREIYLAIQALPEQCSKIVSMSYIEGLKNEEIADTLGLSLQTVKNQKSKGISLLRGKLSSELFMVFVVVFGMK